MRTPLVAAPLFLLSLTSASARGEPTPPRWFADRPVAWHEHDDQDLPRAPAPSRVQQWSGTLLLRDSLANEVDRLLALEGDRPALDRNALDEVPCSTWYCPRNHLRPLSPAELAAGPGTTPPRLPLTIVKGKDEGFASGFQVRDADGRKFLLKLDTAGHLGLATGAERVGNLVFHAAGYNVPGAFLLDLDPGRDLRLAADASFMLHDVKRRPLTEERVRALLARAARTETGAVRAALVPWVAGEVLGGFDLIGRKEDDPNDRIPHQHRRSLRATWVLFAWLAALDPSAINTLDSYVEEDGRRFVRHYFIDFGATLGSSTNREKGVNAGQEHIIEVGRTLGAFASLGLYQRSFQRQSLRLRWEQEVRAHPSVGWFPAESFDPEQYRSNRKLPAHVRRTRADVYWGAKLVTSFSDAQVAVLAAEAGLPAADAAHLARALRLRRDAIGRRYLTAVTAVEVPALGDDGRLCFRDLTLERGYHFPDLLRYQVKVSDGLGSGRPLPEVAPEGPRPCVDLTPALAPLPRETGYRVVELIARPATRQANGRSGPAAAATRVHLRWRAGGGRFVVVGLERDE